MCFSSRRALLLAALITLVSSGCGSYHKHGYVRGQFYEKCATRMSQEPSHAVYYDHDGKVITYQYNGTTTALVEDMSKTYENRLCQARPNGPGPCNPPVPGYCARNYGGFNVCVPC